MFGLFKGTRLNPYDSEEFPRHHVKGCSDRELQLLEKIWYQHPEWQGLNGAQPDWDSLFNELETLSDRQVS